MLGAGDAFRPGVTSALMADDLRTALRLHGSFEFEYGPLGDGTLWVRPLSGSMLRLDDHSLHLLMELQNGRSVDEIAQRHHHDAGEIHGLLGRLQQAGAIRPDRKGKIVRAKRPLDVGLGIWILLAAILGAAQVDYFSSVARTYVMASPIDGIAVALLALAAVFVHEGGHFVAARRFFRPRFGLTWLSVFPAVFVDTQEAWRLGAGARVQINAAGCFFDLLLNTAVVVAVMNAELLGWKSPAAFEYYATPFLLTQYTRWAITLNPFFNGDGYWLLADLSGIVNLRRTASSHLARFQPSLLSGYAIISMVLGVASAFGLGLLAWNIFGGFILRVAAIAGGVDSG